MNQSKKMSLARLIDPYTSISGLCGCNTFQPNRKSYIHSTDYILNGKIFRPDSTVNFRQNLGESLQSITALIFILWTSANNFARVEYECRALWFPKSKNNSRKFLVFFLFGYFIETSCTKSRSFMSVFWSSKKTTLGLYSAFLAFIAISLTSRFRIDKSAVQTTFLLF